MAANTTPAMKKRKPPTFHHLPENRAKKLKRSWVEVQKIKSKWKAQKRKEGLLPKRPTLPSKHEEQHSGNEGRENASPEGDASDTESSAEEDVVMSKGADSDDGEGEEDEDSSTGDEGSPEPDPVERTRRNKGKGKMEDRTKPNRTRPTPPAPDSKTGGAKRRRDQRAEGEEKPSLRELTAQAYSRSSLHTFKSNPRHRNSDAHAAGRGRGRGRGIGRGAHAGRGRGQPDMRLRMNAMLEKIKRDFA